MEHGHSSERQKVRYELQVICQFVFFAKLLTLQPLERIINRTKLFLKDIAHQSRQILGIITSVLDDVPQFVGIIRLQDAFTAQEHLIFLTNI